jgi:hypothetical protein
MQEEAERTIDAVREARMMEFMMPGAEDTLEWLQGQIRLARAIEQSGDGYRLGAARNSLARWFDDYDIEGEQRQVLETAAQGQEPIAADVLAPVLSGLADDIRSGWQTLGAGARALARIGQEGWSEALQNWRKAAETPVEVPWAQDVDYARKVAVMDICAALQDEADSPDPSEFQEWLDDEDERVQIHALRAMCQAGAGREQMARMVSLCDAHKVEEEYAEAIARAGCCALEQRVTDVVEPVYYALLSGDVGLRVRTAWSLSALSLNDTVADALTSYLHQNPPEDVAGVVFALALVNAGRRPGVQLPEADDEELKYALLARRAMLNKESAADALKAAVRGGEPRDRYQAACYLALARVRSAVPVFASVRDQDAPYLLRAFCAGSSIRRGHPAGEWFAKVLKSVRGRVKADVVYHLAWAVEDVTPVMLNRIDVNAGRFV